MRRPATVPLTVNVTEERGFAILRLLKNTDGVVDVGFDLDSLDGKPAPRALTNGAAMPRGGLIPALIAGLMTGPKTLQVLQRAAETAGYSPASVNSALQKMAAEGAAESNGSGTWSLTPKAETGLNKTRAAAQPVHVPPAALPPPKEQNKQNEKGKLRGWEIVVVHMQRAGRAVHRTEVQQPVEKAGLQPTGADAFLARAEQQGFAKRNGSGLWELTAKGKSAKFEE